MQQLSSLDAQFLAIEDERTHGHVCALLMLSCEPGAGGPLTADTLRGFVATGSSALPLLRRRLATVPFGLAHPFWEETAEPDLTYHVRDSALPSPGTAAQLATHVSYVHGQQLNRRRPLWEMHLIHGIGGTQQALLIKAHHAATDGVMGLALLGALLDPAVELGAAVDARRAPARGQPSSPSERMLRSAIRLGAQPLRAAQAVPRVLPHLDAMPMTRAIPGAAPLASRIRGATSRPHTETTAPAAAAPRTVFNGRISAQRSAAFASLPLEAVKEVRTRAAATVNDVVVTLVAGALRAWLRRRDLLPAEPLVAMIPVSMRPPGDAARPGNQVSPMLATIPTDEPDPVRRLTSAHHELRAAKSRHRDLPATLLEDANAFIPPVMFGPVSRAVARLAAHERLAPPCNVVISNLAGPTSALRCGPCRVDELFPMSAIVDGIGLNVTVVSYAGSLRFGIVADRGQMPEPCELAEDVVAALDELTLLLPA